MRVNVLGQISHMVRSNTQYLLCPYYIIVKSKVARCSHLHKNLSTFQLEPKFETKHFQDAGRVCVEINSHSLETPELDLQRKSPSLDDVSEGKYFSNT